MKREREVVTIKGLDKAALDLQPLLGREVAWLIPAEEKRFLSQEFLLELARVLILAFLGGVATEGGKDLYKWIKHGIANLLNGKQVENKEQKIVVASKAIKTAAAMSRKDLELVLLTNENRFNEFLREDIHYGKPEALTGTIKSLVREYILSSFDD